MRNLKKILALVLALMMTVSLMVTANAAGLDIDGELNGDYANAVEVLNSLGVIQGGSNGKYFPDTPITRAEFATMLYRIVTGDVEEKDLSLYAEYANFTDVSADAWYAGAVGYVQGNGLMVGSNGKFSPMRSITGYEVEVGLLRALGWGKTDEFDGAGWAVNASRLATREGVNKVVTDNNVVMSQPATREVVAQLMFNTLFAETQLFGNSAYDGTGVTLGEETLGIEKSDDPEDAYDVFHRPTAVYLKDGKDLVTVVDPDNTLVGKYNGTFTKADYDALAKKGTVTVWYNGGKDDTVKGYATSETDSSINGKAVKGYEVEVYATEAGYDVIVREAYLAVIGAATEATKDAAATIKVTGYVRTKSETKSFDITVSEKADAYEALATHEEGDYVAVYFKPGAAENKAETYVLEVAELDTPIEAKITLIEKSGYATTSSVTAGGETYGLNYQFVVTDDGKTYAQKYPNLGDSTLYLYNGNILLIDQSTADAAAPTAGYAYLYDSKVVKDSGSSSWESEGGEDEGGSSYMVRLLLTDGTTVEVKATIGSEGKDNPKKSLGKLVYFEINAKTGVYSLTACDGVTVDDSNNKANGKLEITTKKSQGKIPGSGSQTNVAFDSKTVFIVVTTDTSDSDAPNYKVTSDIYSIYDVPNFDASQATVTAVTGITTKDGKNTAGKAVEANQVASVVLIVDAGNPTNTLDGTYFIVKNPDAPTYKTYAENGKDIIEYKVYNAVVDGELTTVKVDVKLIDSKFTDGYTLTKLPKTDNGIITNLGTDLTTKDDGLLNITKVSEVKNDHIKLNDGDDYLVSTALSVAFEYSTKDGSIKALTPEKDITSKTAENFKSGAAIVDGKGTTVHALFLTKDET